MSFNPGGYIVQHLLNAMPDELKRKLLQLKVFKAHMGSLGHIPAEMRAIDRMGRPRPKQGSVSNTPMLDSLRKAVQSQVQQDIS